MHIDEKEFTAFLEMSAAIGFLMEKHDPETVNDLIKAATFFANPSNPLKVDTTVDISKASGRFIEALRASVA